MLRLEELKKYFRDVVKLATVTVACVFVLTTQAQENVEHPASDMTGHEAGKEGERLYKDKQYDEALGYLQVASEWGFKDAQARLGQIYLKGLGDVEKNVLRGLAWLGTAASKPSSTGYTRMFEKAMADVPEDKAAIVSQVVDAYAERFGSGQAAVECRMIKPLGSNMSQLSCDYDKRYEYAGNAGSAWSVHEGKAFTL